jgi:hypothetical protein
MMLDIAAGVIIGGAIFTKRLDGWAPAYLSTDRGGCDVRKRRPAGRWDLLYCSIVSRLR